MRGWGAILLVAVALAPASLAEGAPGDARRMASMDDPAGDAHEAGTDTAKSAGSQACYRVVREDECGLVWSTPPQTPEGGVPGRPLLDILHVAMHETPSEILASFTLADLPPDPTAEVARDEWLSYEVRLGPDGNFGVMTFVIEDDHFHSYFWGGPLGADWDIAYEIAPGTPGTLTLRMPRSWHSGTEAGDTIESARARSVIYHARDEAHLEVGAKTPHASRTTETGFAYGEVADYADPFDATFALPHEPSGNLEPFEATDAPDDSSSSDATYEILSARLFENATHVGMEGALASVEDDPAPYYFALLSLPDVERSTPERWIGIEPMAGTYVVEGERRTWSGAVVGTEEGWEWRLLDVRVDFLPGEPGTVRFSWSRADLGQPPQGALVSQAEFMAWRYSNYYHEADDVGTSVEVDPCWACLPAGIGSSAVGPEDLAVDVAELRRPVHLVTAPAAAPPSLTSRVEDATADVVLPQDVALVDPAYAESADVTHVEAKPSAPGASRVALGIRDLGRLDVPAAYDAVVYAVAVETPDGPFMAAYYRSDDVKQFLCAPDTLVLSEEKRDPNDFVWTPIEGTVAAADARQGGGPGELVFRVPNTCFGEEQGASLAGSVLAGGTYLVRNAPSPGGGIVVLDEVSAATPVVLGAVHTPVPPTPWWDAPLGIREFWNILGVGLALAGGAVALGARQRRRSVLQRQMKSIEEAHARLREDPPAWRKAMSERRAAVADLMRRGRLKGEEVLVAERRIELLAADVVEPPKAPAPASVGSVLADRYELRRLLGEGGQGRAFLARDRTLDRDVVVKVLSTGGLDGRAKRLLLAEARLSAVVDHPNVVRVLDVRESEADAQAILILEYVEGGTLRALLDQKGRLPAPQTLALFRGVLAGLQAAHERGVVHRDVKPENVLLAGDGTPKLADFGAARESARQATVVPQATGTLAYMSPEQVRGLRVDARSDVYSAAAMLHEMLSGTRYLPLDEADEFQARAMILERPPEVRLPDDALPLTGVLLRALAKAPGERYASARDLQAALDEASGR